MVEYKCRRLQARNNNFLNTVGLMKFLHIYSPALLKLVQ
jgi:hypothetical protein